ncbi:nicotinate-nicotinamide nucleotide adenylyltransferase [Vibrio hibernica]|uniref:nicotinate-nicotinamide nucleotide adenylyltransferase n=1 Tax=Vibrio hibernica TaxID=2587465 RepID=UPI0018817456|nr:nicotinate-nicotinamide nucleotide adenylyltransferase [Vibrio hibernica]
MATIAVFGSAFNPPSLGHQSVISSLMHFDQILLVPSIAHAWGKSMLEFNVRCQMVERFIADMAFTKVKLSRIESQLYQDHQKSDNYSVTTFEVLCALQEMYPDAELTFVVGPDNFLNFSKFYKNDEIIQRWSVLACPEKLAVRSSDIRRNCSQNVNISHLTTASVRQFIEENQLYKV